FISLEETIASKMISLIEDKFDTGSKEDKDKCLVILSDLGVGADSMTLHTRLSLNSFLLISDFITNHVTISSASLLSLSANAFSG
ncbi:hypothetical protein, partial [Dickeya dianthicola]